MIVQPFRTWHVEEMELQPSQRSWREHGSIAYAQLLASYTAFTARDEMGRVIACAGVVPLERDIGHLWCFLSVHAAAHLLSITRMAARLFAVSGFARLMATTETHFAQGCRWLEVMGFERLHVLPAHGEDTADHFLYVRVT